MCQILKLDDFREPHEKLHEPVSIEDQKGFREMRVRQQIMKIYENEDVHLVARACDAASRALSRGVNLEEAIDVARTTMMFGRKEVKIK